MAKESRVVGSTSQRFLVFIYDSSVSTGAGKTGLAYNTSGIKIYYKRNAGTASVAVTPASITTLGTFVSGGFKEVDATNMPGVYEFHPPDAAFATGADNVVFMISGMTSAAVCPLEIELTATDNQTALLVKKNQALSAFPFPIFDSTGLARTGMSVTAQRSIDGGAFSNCANSVTEIGTGWYKLDLAAADLNGRTIALKFTASGMLDTDYTLVTQG